MSSRSFKWYLQSRGLSKSNIDRIQKEVYGFINWLEDQNIDAFEVMQSDLLAWIREIKKTGIKQNTVQIRLGCLKHYYNWQIYQRLRDDNPTVGIEIRGIKRQILYEILSHQELEQLYNNFTLPEKEPETSPSGMYRPSVLVAKRNKAILSLLIYQGITTSEVQKLSVKDLQLREGKIYVPGGRKSNDRTLELKSHQIMDLMEYTLEIRSELLQVSGKQTDLLFISTGSSNKLSGAIDKMVRKLTESHAKLKNLKQIRASVITHWLGQYNLREVQYRSGHRYVSSTEAYKINRLEDLQADIEKYHPIG